MSKSDKSIKGLALGGLVYIYRDCVKTASDPPLTERDILCIEVSKLRSKVKCLEDEIEGLYQDMEGPGI